MTLIVAVVATLATPIPVVGGGILTLNPSSGPPGTQVDAHGVGYPQNSPISVRWDGQQIATGNSGPGSPRIGFHILFVVPLGALPGPHVVMMCVAGSGATGCTVGGATDTAIFTVVIPAVTPTPAPSLPPPPTPIPDVTPTPEPTLPFPTFPLGGETPSPEPPPIAVVTPAPTPPNQLGDIPEEFPDLWIKAIEVTQGIQDLQNRMPLVEDRRTYARVHVGVIGQPDQANTHGVLEARRNGQQIGWIWAENGPILAKLGAGSRAQADDSLNFRLPQAWLHGEITLRAFVYSYNVATVFEKEAQWQNNLLDVEVVFHPAQPLTVHLVPLHLHRSFHPDDVERTYDPDLDADLLPPTGSATLRAVYGLYRYHPLAQVSLDLFTGPITPMGHGDSHEFNLGGCQTTLLDPTYANKLIIADWEPLMEDPDSIDPGAGGSFEADHPTLRFLDRTFEIDDWNLTDDGVVVWGSQSGTGPWPLPGTPVFVLGCHPTPTGEAEPNQTLAIYRIFYDWDEEEDLFVGLVHPSLPSHFAGLSTKGTDSIWVRMSDTFSDTSPWSYGSAGTLAHEAAHAAGLKHVPCADANEDGVADEIKGGAIDPSHPNALTFPFCSLADVDPEGYYGFDVYWSLFGLAGPTPISNDPDQPPPNLGFPFLSYAGPKWADPYHYCRLLDFYGVPCDPSDLGIPWSEPDAPAGGPLTSPPDPTHDDLPPGANGLIGLSGSIDPAADRAHFADFKILIEHPTLSAMRRFSGQYIVAEVRHKLVVFDAARNELASVPIQQQDTSHGDQAVIAFELLVPVFPNAKSYQIISAGRDLAHLDVSPNAPIVTWGPITEETDTFGRIKVQFHWDSSDADGDPLTHTLLYAPDGEHWQVLATQLNETDFAFLKEALPGGETPVFQVIAFDGTRAGTAVSQPIEPVPGLKPGVVIKVTVSDKHSYPSGAPVLLAANAFDPEDRTLPADAIAWSSSLNGELGTGSELIVDDLKPGTHTITATVTDSDGLTDTSSFELTIDPDVVQGKPDPALVAEIDALFAALAAGEDPAAAVEEAASTSFGDLAPWLVLGLIAAGAAAVGGGFWWRSRSSRTLA